MLRRVVSIGALGLTLAACGGGRQDDLEDAIDHFNAARSSAVRSEDVTTGSSYSAKFGADAEEQLRRQGRPCTVSPASGTISLD